MVHSRLDQREEAIVAFRRVLEHGPRTAEADAARRWLADAGALPPVVEATAAAGDKTLPAGRVEGRTEWPRPPEQGLPKLQILLVGNEGEVRGPRASTSSWRRWDRRASGTSRSPSRKARRPGST